MWEAKRLGDIAKVISGYAFSSNDFCSDKGVHVIKIANIGDGSVEFNDSTQFVNDKYLSDLDKKYIVKNGDVLISLTGSHITQPNSMVGRTAIYRKEFVALLNQRAGKIIGIKNRGHEKFIYYILRTQWIREYIGIIAHGAANQANISPKSIEKIKALIPPLTIQQKIADLLSTYDDLIENNNRRIELLEKAAQNLYKEWFVRFRFPNYEETKFENGLPHGWKTVKLGDIADINSKSIGKGFKHSIINYIDISSVQCGQILSKSEFTLSEAPGRAKRIISDGDVIWSMVRPNLKAFALILNPMENDIVSTGFAVITARKAPFSYIYCSVTENCFVNYLINTAKGAAYPAVTASEFENADIVLPNYELLKEFHKTVEPFYRQKEIMKSKNSNLIKQRDLLLPRLMSGKLEI